MPTKTNFDKLTDGNYFEWRIYMEVMLTRKSLLEYVNRSKRHPGGSDRLKKVQEFYQRPAEARAKIILRVTPSQLAHCRNSDPMIIWNDLATIHSSHGHSTIIALCRRFHHLRLEHAETMSAYIARIHHIAFLLKEANVTIAEDNIILGITSGLPRLYDSFLISLDATADSDFMLNNVIAHLINEYQCQHQNQPRSQNTENSEHDEAMHVTNASSQNSLAHITCFACGQKGHFQLSPNCPSHQKSSPPTTIITAPPKKQSNNVANAFEEVSSNEEGVF